MIISLGLMSCENLFSDDDIDYPDTGGVTTIHYITMGVASGEGFPGNVFEKSLGEFSYDRSANFVTRGNQYEISELIRDSTTGEIIFRYKPRQGYVGEDYVEILAPTDINGNFLHESLNFEFHFEMVP